MSPSPSALEDDEDEDEGHTVVATARGIFNSNGGVLSSIETGVSIIIPQGAIPDGVEQEIYFKVCRDNSILPPLDKEKGKMLKKNGGRKKTKCTFCFCFGGFLFFCCPHVPPYIHLTDQCHNKRNDSEYPLKEQSVLSLPDEAVMSPVQFFIELNGRVVSLLPSPLMKKMKR